MFLRRLTNQVSNQLPKLNNTPSLYGSYFHSIKKLSAHPIVLQKKSLSTDVKADQIARLKHIQTLVSRILNHNNPIFPNSEIHENTVRVPVSSCTSVAFKPETTDTNIVKSLFDAFVSAETRKLIENFKYKNKVVFSSTLDDLVEFTGTDNFFKGRPPNQEKAKTIQEITDIFNQISCDHPVLTKLRFRFSCKKSDKGENIVLVQALVDAPCAITGIMTEQRGGKNYVSCFSMEDEIVQKALGMCMSVLSHELRESASFVDDNGKIKKIFYPHMVLSDFIKFRDMRHQHVAAPKDDQIEEAQTSSIAPFKR